MFNTKPIATLKYLSCVVRNENVMSKLNNFAIFKFVSS